MDTEIIPLRPSTVKGGRSTHSPLDARTELLLRFSFPVLPSQIQLRGDRAYLRALRAAEMKAWQASGGDVFRPPFAE